jgi:hypothetical protein
MWCDLTADDCGDLEVANAAVTDGVITSGAVREYACIPGYTKVGTGGHVTCTAGSWGTPTVTCTGDCSGDPSVDNAVISDGPSLTGTMREYSCSAGYTKGGPGGIVTCTAGTWGTPTVMCTGTYM